LLVRTGCAILCGQANFKGRNQVSKERFLVLDGLRGVAAIAVILFHRRWWAPSGHLLDHAYLAVDFFFVLSGFVLAHAYGDRLRAGMRFIDFAKTRAIRLYPLLMLGAAIGLSYVALKEIRHGDGLDWSFALVALCAALAIPSPPTRFSSQPFAINGPEWSLFFELVVNAAYALWARRLTDARLTILLIASFVWLAISIYGHGNLKIGNTYDSFWGGVPRTLFSFAVGTLIYTVHQKLPRLPIPAPTLVLGGALVAVFCPNSDSIVPDALYDAVCVAIILPFIVLLGAISDIGNDKRLAEGLGVISYPVYILHVPLLNFYEIAATKLGIALSERSLLIAAAAIVSICAIVSKLYDEPMRRAILRRVQSSTLGETRRARAAAPT
jgi:peptidoglycan/LPS O-acetylase OafA/YrhL